MTNGINFSDLTLKVMCDDISTIFVDGKQKNVPGTEKMKWMATLKISNTTKTIGVQCNNTGGEYGVMVQVTDQKSGEVIAVTDDSWQCSNIPEDGWSTREFSGNWTEAQITFNQQYFQRESGDMAFNSPDRKIIWTNSSADRTVFCRKDLPSESCRCLRKGGLSTFVKF